MRLVYNIVNKIDLDATKAKVEKYKQENQVLIHQNQALKVVLSLQRE